MVAVLGKEVVTYEEMTKVEPQSGRPRPIMLIGTYVHCYKFYNRITSGREGLEVRGVLCNLWRIVVKGFSWT